MNRIHINQLGYRSNNPKKVVITVNPPNVDTGIDFSIVHVSDEKIVYSGTTSKAVSDSASRDMVRIADFSGFTEAGEYVIYSGALRSYPFAIGDNPYAGLRAAVLEMFHYQKCGVDLEWPCMNIARDPAINAHCPDAPPAKRYVDHKDSFASNEVAIYWNSPMYFVMAVLGL